MAASSSSIEKHFQDQNQSQELSNRVKRDFGMSERRRGLHAPKFSMPVMTKEQKIILKQVLNRRKSVSKQPKPVQKDFIPKRLKRQLKRVKLVIEQEKKNRMEKRQKRKQEIERRQLEDQKKREIEERERYEKASPFLRLQLGNSREKQEDSSLGPSPDSKKEFKRKPKIKINRDLASNISSVNESVMFNDNTNQKFSQSKTRKMRLDTQKFGVSPEKNMYTQNSNFTTTCRKEESPLIPLEPCPKPKLKNIIKLKKSIKINFPNPKVTSPSKPSESFQNTLSTLQNTISTLFILKAPKNPSKSPKPQKSLTQIARRPKN
ncbi:unnamed protein product [Moneuplotes crassus]|uniref:Uncharacterized protein n=1 Tax=Euplotes crassus TaxID=5936 RepID=A0AAD1UHE7_EUPCR|nr:unnamed protein product [Moneuplotes crassus]